MHVLKNDIISSINLNKTILSEFILKSVLLPFCNLTTLNFHNEMHVLKNDIISSICVNKTILPEFIRKNVLLLFCNLTTLNF